jgi:hypothetical protein
MCALSKASWSKEKTFFEVSLEQSIAAIDQRSEPYPSPDRSRAIDRQA